MSERRALPALLLATFIPATFLLADPATAQTKAGGEPSVTILDLPFRARAMRGPGSEAAVAVATSGLLPVARRRNAGRTEADDDGAPIAVVWGDDGGAALRLVDGTLTTTLLGAEAIAGLAAAETPRGALPGLRRALAGPVSAHLAGPMGGGAASLVIRERQPVAISAEPQPVPILTTTVPASPGAFAARRPRAALIDGRPVFLAVTTDAAGASALALIGKAGPTGDWAIVARGGPQAGAPGGQPLEIAAIADFSGQGRPGIAAVSAPDGAGALQVWAVEGVALRLAHEAPGYTNLSPGEGGADLAATIDADGAGAAELALPVSDRSALAIVSLKTGIVERARIPLPGLAAFGVAALGRGARARLLVGLADGRIALVSPRP